MKHEETVLAVAWMYKNQYPYEMIAETMSLHTIGVSRIVERMIMDGVLMRTPRENRLMERNDGRRYVSLCNLDSNSIPMAPGWRPSQGGRIRAQFKNSVM